MPELPEVETIVRGLAPRLRGRKIRAVWWSGKPLHLRRKVDLAGLRAVAVGQAISSVRRLGKYIVLGVADDAGVVIHLGMTGTRTSPSRSTTGASCASPTRAGSAGSSRPPRWRRTRP